MKIFDYVLPSSDYKVKVEFNENITIVKLVYSYKTIEIILDKAITINSSK